ncbi:MAG: hypothetical protein LBT24_02595 [Tannerella sp.]|jgi:hypothetical protein|nr:hypothetical protein [Tannerella sp.]
MLQTVSLDTKTLLIKAEHESDMSYQNKQNRQKNVDELLDFASKKRIIESNYKFNREECYDK